LTALFASTVALRSASSALAAASVASAAWHAVSAACLAAVPAPACAWVTWDQSTPCDSPISTSVRAAVSATPAWAKTWSALRAVVVYSAQASARSLLRSAVWVWPPALRIGRSAA
jgi:hypothetical protein